MVFNAKGARLYRKVRRVIFPAFLNRKGTEGEMKHRGVMSKVEIANFPISQTIKSFLL
jgi:hypothetical protein